MLENRKNYENGRNQIILRIKSVLPPKVNVCELVYYLTVLKNNVSHQQIGTSAEIAYAA